MTVVGQVDWVLTKLHMHPRGSELLIQSVGRIFSEDSSDQGEPKVHEAPFNLDLCWYDTAGVGIAQLGPSAGRGIRRPAVQR